MARKLRTFQTSLGFYDLAIAAPSMKAALEAWGAGSNLFHQGIAREADDPAVIEAAMAKPGVVLKRPAGSHGRFSEHAEVPSRSAADDVADKPRRKSKAAKPDKRPPRKPSEAAARQAAGRYEKEQERREAQRRRAEEVRAKARERREQAITKAQSALEEARQEHEARAAAIEAERAAVNARAEAEDERWTKQKAKLIDALRRARES
jgi:hypothetical protein